MKSYNNLLKPNGLDETALDRPPPPIALDFHCKDHGMVRCLVARDERAAQRHRRSKDVARLVQRLVPVRCERTSLQISPLLRMDGTRQDRA